MLVTVTLTVGAFCN